MKAILCSAYGPIDGLTFSDLPEPEASGSRVVIKARAIGVNYPDGLLVQGLYQAKPELPFIPGMEMAGIVESVGPDVKHLKPGMRVVATAGTGAFAQKGVFAEAQCIPLPDQISDEDACALMCGFGTSHHALKQRGHLKPGETLVVAGAAGATGLAAVEIGKAMGATVIAIASTDEKREAARQAGADHVIGYDNLKETLRELAGRQGVDVVFDPVGGDTFDTLVRTMGRNGRYLVVGFAAGRIPQLPVNLALVKEFSLIGVFWGAFTQHEPAIYAENVRELFGWYLDGKVKPLIGARYPLSDAPKVLTRLMERGVSGKIVLEP
ncbi:NADPH:quinone oxidoreductase family protein [Rhizobium sp. C1]|uniref:NADPH:quinone oxidoreductase family protein n=1 Tax=Rhizobium sp. C1 TaxID=1349799 RepID=UPI001E54A7AA|nr:NADPH:quinone oxidoreductase family protein [Rhizobium sp. C1]MCD2178067.1 NADPH:quinone oxidoreductase family protein [Rhizobium sp. C1]